MRPGAGLPAQLVAGLNGMGRVVALFEGTLLGYGRVAL